MPGNKEITILAVDDTEANLRLIQRFLRLLPDEIDFKGVSTLDAAESVLAELPKNAPLVALLDERLADEKTTDQLASNIASRYGESAENLLMISISGAPEKLKGIVHLEHSTGQFDVLIHTISAFVSNGSTAAIAAFHSAKA